MNITLRNRKAYENGEHAEEIAQKLYGLEIDRTNFIDGKYNGKPIEIKSCQEWQRNGIRRCRGRFVLSRSQHNELIEKGGYYLFIVQLEGGGIRHKVVKAADVPFKRKLCWTKIFGGEEG